MKVTMGDSELCIKPFVQGTDNKEKVYELLLHSLEWALGVSKGASFSNLSNVLMFQNGFQSWAPTGPVQTSSHQQYATMICLMIRTRAFRCWFISLSIWAARFWRFRLTIMKTTRVISPIRPVCVCAGISGKHVLVFYHRIAHGQPEDAEC